MPVREKHILPEEVISKIFGTLETITSLNTSLLFCLRERLHSGFTDDICVGDIFIERVCFFLLLYSKKNYS